ncbi:uncharacterized protein LOC128359814 [Scomber scombrus]|uniref:Uncharacterized protein LOC128359814 n=1 Tax=Scomber scombrus TaxID=13677 RepID=A0AAV1PTP4_SCOSC
MEGFFNVGLEEIKNELTKAKKVLDNMRASRSAFSVALSSDSTMKCHVPFTINKNIVYQHVFLNLGGGYDEQTGIFTVPYSGVYSLTLTLYGNAVFLGEKLSTCASLRVNTQVVGTIVERNGSDREDSATVFVAVELKAGDQVAVSLLEGCFICDDNNHYNTFTGFLLYSTD